MLTLLREAVWRAGCGNTSERNKERALGRWRNVDVAITSSICERLPHPPLSALSESQVAWSFQRQPAGKIYKSN